MTAFAEEPLLTPSKVTAWLDCPHYLALWAQVDEGILERPEPRYGSFARLLLDKGLAHEQACLAAYESQGRRVLKVPGRARGADIRVLGRWHRRPSGRRARCHLPDAVHP